MEQKISVILSTGTISRIIGQISDFQYLNILIFLLFLLLKFDVSIQNATPFLRRTQVIRIIPMIAGISSDCLNTTTEIAVNTIPRPAQMAKANSNGIYFNACEKKKKQAIKAIILYLRDDFCKAFGSLHET